MLVSVYKKCFYTKKFTLCYYFMPFHSLEKIHNCLLFTVFLILYDKLTIKYYTKITNDILYPLKYWTTEKLKHYKRKHSGGNVPKTIVFFLASDYQKLIILLNNTLTKTERISIPDSNEDNFVKVIRCSIVFGKSCKRIAPGCSHNGLYIRKWEMVYGLVTNYFRRLVTAFADAFEA